MTKPEEYIRFLLINKGFNIPAKKEALFSEFVKDPANLDAARTILENQQRLMINYNIKNRVHDILTQQVMLPNATVNKAYEATLDLEKLGWKDLPYTELEDLGDYGLSFDAATGLISGTPGKSGDFKLKLKFRVEGEEDASTFNEKTINLIINPDPKSLWKNLESDKSDPYWKEDNVTASAPLGDKHLVVASRRGRSHANVGSFRDDDFSYAHFSDSGWSVVVLADGAGSAKFSRKGSQLACESVVNYFKENTSKDGFKALDELIQNQEPESTLRQAQGESNQKLNHAVYTQLGNAALYVHHQLEQFAAANSMELKDLHSTLIFTLIKKYAQGYALLSFSVGDCPIAVLNKDMSNVTLLNKLDVGEFGGGTRFITMPEIFSSDSFSGRFSFKLLPDFSYLFLMTDGIYDPKFSVEANLEKTEYWNNFVSDLQGGNADKAKVILSADNTEMEQQLATWMDFWSPGNHDDRTLAILF